MKLSELKKLEWNPRTRTTRTSNLYCDPPYKGTATYKEWWFDHDKFWDWAREKTRTHKIFVSEYNAPDDFKTIFEFSQKSTLNGGMQLHNSQPNEKVFTI